MARAVVLTSSDAALAAVLQAARPAGDAAVVSLFKGLAEASPAVAREAWSWLDRRDALRMGQQVIAVGVAPGVVLADLELGAALVAGFDPQLADHVLAAVEEERPDHAAALCVAAALVSPVAMAGVVEVMLIGGRGDVPGLLAALPAPAAAALLASVDWDQVGVSALFRLLTALSEGHRDFDELAAALTKGSPDELTRIGKALADTGKWPQLARLMNQLGDEGMAAALLVAVAGQRPAGALGILDALVPALGELTPQQVLDEAFQHAHPQVILPTAELLSRNPKYQPMLIHSLEYATPEGSAEVYGGIINANTNHPEATIAFLKLAQNQSAQAAGAAIALIMGMPAYRQAMVMLGSRLIINGADDTAFLVGSAAAAPADAAADLVTEALIYLDTHDGGDADGHFVQRVYNALTEQPALLARIIERLAAGQGRSLLTRLLSNLTRTGQADTAAAILAAMAPATAAQAFSWMDQAVQGALVPHLPAPVLTAIATAARPAAVAQLLTALHTAGRTEEAAGLLAALAPAAAVQAFNATRQPVRGALGPHLPAPVLTSLATAAHLDAVAQLLTALHTAGRTEEAAAILAAMAPARAAYAFSWMNQAVQGALLPHLPAPVLTALATAANPFHAAHLLRALHAAGRTQEAAGLLAAMAPAAAAEVFDAMHQPLQSALGPHLPAPVLTAIATEANPDRVAQLLTALHAAGRTQEAAGLLAAMAPARAAHAFDSMDQAVQSALLPHLPGPVLTRLSG
ncbi:hypothetical protein ACIQWN_37510 [Streptomyces vinaceus]|uniref:hypothetical protein n=1 Tax=Streptomyces vinaceus TaxID=1960 RepID=UPI00382B0F2B